MKPTIFDLSLLPIEKTRAEEINRATIPAITTVVSLALKNLKITDSSQETAGINLAGNICPG